MNEFHRVFARMDRSLIINIALNFIFVNNKYIDKRKICFTIVLGSKE